MKLDFTPEDRKKLEQLRRTMRNNRRILELYAAYLNEAPDYITPEMIRELTDGCGVGIGQAYYAAMCAALALDADGCDRTFASEYILPSLRLLRASDYTSDPYYSSVRIPSVSEGEWSLGIQSFKPFEAFACGESYVGSDFREIPTLGYFTREFKYPSVFQGGREWMAVKPNEIETMKKPVAAATGNVLTFGLGMGYFAYMASLQDAVKSVTVVEADASVISLFEQYIAPQFPKRNKISIIHADARDFTVKDAGYDYVFTDIWHDVSDGLDLYLEMKKAERECSGVKFSYWIESTLLSYLRRMIFAGITDTSDNSKTLHYFDELTALLGDDYLRRIAADISRA